MSENAELQVALKANADQLLAAIKQATSKIGELGDKIKSLPSGDRQFNKLSRELARTSLSQQKLIDSYDRLNTEVPAANTTIQQSTDVTKRARNAFTSLSLVVQDLPYGFIGIQNNLPALIQNFGLLTSELQKGAIPSTKELLTNLAGPAAFLAFSAITSSVTYLTKEYGSLNNAIKAFINGNQDIVKSQNLYNKEIVKTNSETTTELKTINILSSVLTNLKKPLADRQAAYDQLKKIQPDVIAGIDRENISNAEALKIIEANAKAKVRQIQLEAKEAALKTVINQNAAKQQELEIARKPLLDALIKAQNLYNTGVALGTIEAQKRYGALSQEEIQLNSAKQALTNNINEYNKLVPIQDEYLNQLNPIVLEISKLTSNFSSLVEEQKKSNKEFKTSNEEIRLWVGFTGRAAAAGDQFDRIVRENQRNLDGWRYIIDQVAQNAATLKTNLDGLSNTSQRIANISFDNLFSNLMNQDMLLGLEEFQRKINNVFKSIDQNTKNQTRALQQRFNFIKGLIEGALVAPLDYLFNTIIEKGKFSWKEFGNIVVEQLKRIIIQIAATAAATAIADALTGGAYGATVRVADKLTGGSTGIGSSESSAVNFGGIQGVGGMTGEVVFVQRGADLVGVLNRTNSNINRIG